VPSVPNPPTVNFEGISIADTIAVGQGFIPPDTNGAVGPNHYVQTVNSSFRIWNKAGAPLIPTTPFSTLFAPLGGACGSSNDGDPIVLYDQLADRWLISQFCTVADPNNHQLIAISKTGDPTGAYYLYDFMMPNNKFNDYPKFGVWPDAYYMTDNQFNQSATAFLQAGAFAFNRSKMLVGDPTAGFVYFDTAVLFPPNVGINGPFGIGGLLPAGLDGFTPPPAGAPCPFAYFQAGEFGEPGDQLRLFDFHVDFVTPANSTFVERTGSPLPVAAFDPVTVPDSRNVIPQPPPSAAASRLDAINDRLMFRLAYRNFGTSESLIANHTVNAAVNPAYRAAVRFYQLRRNTPAGAFTIAEQQTFDGGGGTEHRWMGSGAMNFLGDIAVGYSVSSSTVFPSVRYAAKLNTDPAGSGLAQGEQNIIGGGGSQTHTSGRWGDYSSMAIDPVDDATFWYTQEYYPVSAEPGNTDAPWHTRIAKFAPGPTAVSPRGTISGTITRCDNSAPISGAFIQITNGFSRATLANGTYSATVPPGTYNATATGPGYDSKSASSLVVSNGGNATFNACLNGILKLPAADTATVTADNCNANGKIDPNETVTLSLGIKNIGTLNTANLVATLQATGGVTSPSGPQNYGVVVQSGPAIFRSFTFTAGNLACGAPLIVTLQLQDGATNLGTISYNLVTGLQLVALAQNFDGVTTPALPAGWMAINASGAAPLWVTSSTTPHTAPNSAFVNDPATVSDKRLETPAIAITSASAQAIFRNNYNLEAGFDGGLLEVSSPNINGGAFTDILNPAVGGSFVSGGYNGTISTNSAFMGPIPGRQAWTGSSGGYITTIANLGPNVQGQTIKLRFRMGSDNDVASGGWRIDTVLISNGFACCGIDIAAAPPAVVTAESAFPANDVPDPNERLTVSLPLINLGTTSTTNLVATLQATGGVTSPSGPQSYGVVMGVGPAVARSFTFTANGSCGSNITLTLALQDGVLNLGTVTYSLRLGTVVTNPAQTFSNPASITIPATGTGEASGAPATPYPSNITVAGVPNGSAVTVRLKNLNHTYPSDVDVLLVGPTGQKFILLSDAIGDPDAVGINYTFTDAAAEFLPTEATPVSGTFKPTNYITCQDPFPAPAPAGPYNSPGGSSGTACGAATLNSTFGGLNPNGVWKLFVVDDAGQDVGNFSGGWEISFTSTSNVCSAPVSALSRRVHGATPFDIDLPLAGNPGIECRAGAAGDSYMVKVKFPNVVTFGSAAVTSGSGMVSSTSGSGTTELTANLTGVTSVQTITVTLFGVNDGVNTGDIGIPMGVLVGDTNGNRSVNSTDVGQTKTQSGQPVSMSNFRSDVVANGMLNATDISTVKTRAGGVLPP
jgi:subtilisin-like proprotein convertase family protein